MLSAFRGVIESSFGRSARSAGAGVAGTAKPILEISVRVPAGAPGNGNAAGQRSCMRKDARKTRPLRIPTEGRRFLTVDATETRNRRGFSGVSTLSQGG
jgi:hypothetical protein